jgi:hypothetical protein
LDLCVAGDEGESLDQGLRYQHAVEGITMVLGQAGRDDRVSIGNGEGLKSTVAHAFGKVVGADQFAERVFDRDLPDGRGTHVDIWFVVE